MKQTLAGSIGVVIAFASACGTASAQTRSLGVAPAQEHSPVDHPSRDGLLNDGRQWLENFDRQYGLVVNGNDYPAGVVEKVPGAMANAAIARAESRQQYAELNRVIRWKAEDFENSAAFRATVRELDDAYEAYLAARDRVLRKLEDDPAYRAAVALRDQMGSDIKDMRAAAAAAHDDDEGQAAILAVASVKLTHASVARDLEAAALSNDADVIAARRQMVDAARKLSDARDDFLRDLRRSDEVARARDSFGDARIARLGAEAYLRGAIDAARSAVDYSYYIHRYDRYRSSPYHGLYDDDGYCLDGIYGSRY